MTTPVRQQYLRIKKQFPDTIVLFRLGDFYETFDDDAKIVSGVCNIVLTGREMGTGQRVPLAGVPYHSLETHLAKLIQAGYKVAIVEQMTDEPQRGLMPREVTRVVTPGTVTEPALLEDKRNNYLAAVVADGGRAGIAHVDITTGEFAATEVEVRELRPEIERLQPTEILVDARDRGRPAAPEQGELPAGARLSPVRIPDQESARQRLCEHWHVAALDGFGLAELPLATRAAGAILSYLQENQKAALAQLTSIRVYSTQSFMVLDPATRRNLELVSSTSGQVQNSLLGVLDLTRTPMGGRLLRRWVTQPLLDLSALQARLARVQAFCDQTGPREEMRSALRSAGDLERLTNRILQGIATPRDLLAIKTTLNGLPPLIAQLDAMPPVEGQSLAENLDPCVPVSELVARAIRPDAPANLANGGVIAAGYSAELDGIMSASRNAKDYVASLERAERERSGIKSLRVGYNRVFGYYIEVTTPNLPQVPADYIRKQTLANAERYITPELKEYEALILNADERMIELETTLFREVCATLVEYAPRLLTTARLLAELDVWSTLAEVAERNRYVRPKLNDAASIVITGGRHPVVERALQATPFVPNDVTLTSDAAIHILTGPNMSGKSTFLRQVALIVLMAQMGSFVPAERAEIGLVDRIFTRIGAHDDISLGQSTFMVEMVETANILRNATDRSLIILDEIGRGTSTYDGIAIARAVLEYLHNHPRLGSKTLFATHYHELTECEGYLPRVRNYNVAVIEQDERVVFMHKIVPGGADKSYGIHVAEIAGVPAPVIHRAQEVLHELEEGHNGRAEAPIQLTFFAPEDELREELRKLDPLSLSPLEALNKLFELHKKAEKK